MTKFGQFEADYQRNKYYWGTKPSSVVADQVGQLKPGSVLDIGAGDGRNAIFLAQQGFAVTALDIAPTGLQNLTEKAAAAGVAIETIQADIRDYQPDRLFDNVISNFTLHFLGQHHLAPTLQKIVDTTAPDGINLIDDFTQNGPLAAKNPENYLTANFLIDFYARIGWKIIYKHLRPVQTKAVASTGVPYTQEAITLITRQAS